MRCIKIPRCGPNELLSGSEEACTCATGYGAGEDGVCRRCAAGSVHVYDASKEEKEPCEPCADGAVADAAQAECVGEEQCGDGNGYLVEN